MYTQNEEVMKNKGVETEVNSDSSHGNHGKDMVDIYVNEKQVSIHRGSRLVSEVKILGGVPSTDILYLMPNYEVALKDNESVTIKGGEHFKSSAPSGASS